MNPIVTIDCLRVSTIKTFTLNTSYVALLLIGITLNGNIVAFYLATANQHRTSSD
jgi:hypothetical protein